MPSKAHSHTLDARLSPEVKICMPALRQRQSICVRDYDSYLSVMELSPGFYLPCSPPMLAIPKLLDLAESNSLQKLTTRFHVARMLKLWFNSTSGFRFCSQFYCCGS